MTTLSAGALGATTRYEFRMAARRRVLWWAMLPLLAVAALVGLTSPMLTGLRSATAQVGAFAVIVNVFTVAGVGVALADRFRRGRRRGLSELLDATPAGPTGRLVGSVLGSLAAALAPVLAVLLLVGVGLAVADGTAAAVPAALLAFVVVIVPAAVVVTLFAATLGLLVPVPLTRVLVVVAWFWATLLNRSLVPVPTATGTVLSPLGDYAAARWLHAPVVWAGRGSPAGLSPAVGTAAAVTNIAVLLVLAGLLFLVARATLAVRRGD